MRLLSYMQQSTLIGLKTEQFKKKLPVQNSKIFWMTVRVVL